MSGTTPRECLIWSGLGLKYLHFWQVPKWCCCWHPGTILWEPALHSGTQELREFYVTVSIMGMKSGICKITLERMVGNKSRPIVKLTYSRENMGEVVISLVLSCCNKNLKRWMDRCYRPRMDQCYSSVLQLSLFRKQRKIHPGGMKVGWPKRCEEKGNPWPNFGSSFYMSFPPPGLPYVNWASQECCLFYLRSSLWSSDLPLFYFRGLFPSLSFSHPHSGLFFPYSNYLTVGREALIINNRTDSFPLKGRSGGTVRFYLSYWFSGH